MICAPGTTGVALLRAAEPSEVAAVEVYSGTSMPVEFSSPGQNCTSIVVWTKTRVQSRRK